MDSLEDLVAPASPATFLEHFVSKTRWLSRTDAPRRAELLLPWSEIDRLFSKGGIPAEHFRVIVNRNPMDPRLYLDETSGRLRPDVLQNMAVDGATMRISGISKLTPAVGRLGLSIERDLGHRVNINCYLTFGEHSAFHAHYDDHDVIILQVHGSKHWRSFGVDAPFPVEGTHTSRLTTPVWEEVLGPGDLLYLPRGEVHSAIPVQRPSVHLTIGVQEATGVDFIEWLARRARSDEVFRMNLARNATPEQRAARETALKAAIHALVETSSVGQFLADDDGARTPLSVAAFNIAGRLGPSSLVASGLRRRVDLKLEDPGERSVEIGGKRVRLSPLARRILDFLSLRNHAEFSALATEVGCEPDDAELGQALVYLARNGMIHICDSAVRLAQD